MRIRHLRTEKGRQNFLSRLVYTGKNSGCHRVMHIGKSGVWEIRSNGHVWYSSVGSFVWERSERVRGIEAKLVKMAAFPHYLEDE